MKTKVGYQANSNGQHEASTSRKAGQVAQEQDSLALAILLGKHGDDDGHVTWVCGTCTATGDDPVHAKHVPRNGNGRAGGRDHVHHIAEGMLLCVVLLLFGIV